VEHSNQVKNLTLYVVETQGPTLFRRDWLHQIQLDWKQICTLSKEKPPQETQKKLEKLLDEYSEVRFQNEIGTLKSTKTKLTLKEHSQAKFYKARPVSKAMKPKVEVKLKRLEEDGIRSKAKFVGTVRICGDYKITVNPNGSQRSNLSLASMTYLLSWQGGKKFTKIDLRQAYYQMEVEST